MSSVPNSELRPFAIKNALVVDADPQINALLSSVLDPGSWAVQHTPDNLGALALARKKAFDLIVTSAKTSGRVDIELLRRIRMTRPHTRLIILAGQSTPADVITSMRERAFSYFSQPFSLDALAAMIRIATEGPSWDDGIEVISATPEWIQVQARCDAAIANPDDEPIRHLAVREEQGMRPGGFGVLLAQKLVDELIYGQYGNEVLLVKYLDSAKPSDSPP